MRRGAEVLGVRELDAYTVIDGQTADADAPLHAVASPGSVATLRVRLRGGVNGGAWVRI